MQRKASGRAIRAFCVRLFALHGDGTRILHGRASGRATRGICKEEQVGGRQEESAKKSKWMGDKRNLQRRASGRATRGICKEEQVDGRQEESARKSK